MKKSFMAALLAVAVLLCGGIGPACTPQEPSQENPPVTQPELQEGTITFEDSTCESIIGRENSGTVAVATASNGAEVTYSLSGEEAEALSNAFGGALSIAPDGTILGKYDSIKRFKVDITASAEKCPSVTAEVMISVVNPHLTYTGMTLVDARQGVEYAASVAYVAEGSANATYKLQGELPAGLSLDRTGMITGTPTQVGPGQPFGVTASARGYSDTTAYFTIDVVIDRVSEAPSKIVRFESEQPVVLNSAYIGEYYVNQSGVARGTALNSNHISYRLAEGSTLPEGFTLYPSGALVGSSQNIGEHTFTVIASAYQCADVSCTFVLPVSATMIKYESQSITLTKGEAANQAINTAVVADDSAITYSMTEQAAAELSSKYGLTVTEQGYVTGTPTAVAEQISFVVTASAEGYSPTSATIYARINEPRQAPANGRFEAEYTDLSGKQGTGYSASPSGKALIDATNSSVSNGAFINYMHNSTITLEFVVWVESDMSGVPLYICLGSEIGNVTFSPSNLGVYTYAGRDTSGIRTTVNYSSVQVNGGNQLYGDFVERQFGTVNLTAGWNVIQIAVLANDLRGAGSTGGPGIDYIRLDASGVEWVPLTFNLN